VQFVDMFFVSSNKIVYLVGALNLVYMMYPGTPGVARKNQLKQ